MLHWLAFEAIIGYGHTAADPSCPWNPNAARVTPLQLAQDSPHSPNP